MAGVEGHDAASAPGGSGTGWWRLLEELGGARVPAAHAARELLRHRGGALATPLGDGVRHLGPRAADARRDRVQGAAAATAWLWLAEHVPERAGTRPARRHRGLEPRILGRICRNPASTIALGECEPRSRSSRSAACRRRRRRRPKGPDTPNDGLELSKGRFSRRCSSQPHRLRPEEPVVTEGWRAGRCAGRGLVGMESNSPFRILYPPIRCDRLARARWLR